MARQLTVQIVGDASGLRQTLDSTGDQLERFGTVAGAALVAAGAGLEAFARSQGESNFALERMGRVTGEGAQAMRDMAGDLQNVTFPMGEVVALMETATQRGLEGQAIADYASFWDMVGDATGEAGPALGEAGVALAAVGIAAGQEAEALNAFGFITDHTTSSVGEFLAFLERTGPQLRDMGADVDDAAAILGVLETEFGMTGRTARQEFRKAVNEADGDLDKMLETLGVSSEVFEEYRGKVDASSGAIEANAEAFRDSLTPMQEMQARVEALMFEYGGFADAAGMLAMPLMALGSTMVLVAKLFQTSAATKVAAMAKTVAATVASTGVMVAKWAWAGVQALAHAAKVAAAWLIAMGPIALVIAAVIGLVALIVANWDTIVRVTKDLWEAVTGWFSDLRDSVVGFVTELVDRVVGFFAGLRDTLIGIVEAIFTAYITFWGDLFTGVVDIVTNLRDKVVEFVGNLRDRAVEIASGLRDRVVEFFAGLKDGAIEQIQALIDRVRGIKDDILGFFAGAGRWLLDIGRQIIEGLWTGLKERWERVKSWLSGIGDTIKSLKGPIEQDRRLLFEQGKAIFQGLGEGMRSGWADAERFIASRNTAIPAAIHGASHGGLAAAAGRGTTIVYNVDARYATEGTADMITHALEAHGRALVEQIGGRA